jgi:hypothetical protein
MFELCEDAELPSRVRPTSCCPLVHTIYQAALYYPRCLPQLQAHCLVDIDSPEADGPPSSFLDFCGQGSTLMIPEIRQLRNGVHPRTAGSTLNLVYNFIQRPERRPAASEAGWATPPNSLLAISLRSPFSPPGLFRAGYWEHWLHGIAGGYIDLPTLELAILGASH